MTKGQTINTVNKAYQAGITHCGENYLNEALDKITHCFYPITWHFIGRIQSNKIKKIAHYFDWVDSVVSIQQLEKLSKYRAQANPPLSLCLQVTSPKHPHPYALTLPNIAECMAYAQSLPHIKVRGLMILPNPNSCFEDRHLLFRRIAKYYAQNKDTYQWDTLNMGMSADYQLALANILCNRH